MTICRVYWIRHKDHTDIFSQGYIGITSKDGDRRFIEHKSAMNRGSSLTVHNAMRKCGDDIIFDIVLIASQEYCFEVENKLRPEVCIGWNINIGGQATRLGSKHSKETIEKLKVLNSRPCSDETKQKLREAFLGKSLHTEETKQHLSILAKERVEKDGGIQIHTAIQKAAEVNRSKMPWENPNADESVWLMAGDIFVEFSSGEIPYRAAKKLKISPDKLVVMYKKFKSGWNPNNCPDWQKFKLNKGKKDDSYCDRH